MSTPASEQSVFLHAIGLGSAAERAAYLDDVCRDNPGLRAELDALLAAHDRLGGRGPGATASFAAGDVSATLAHTAELGSGTVLAGRYKLVERIGEGGMGAVWTAQQTEPVKRTVAVKLIKPGMDSRQVLARFEAERQALALMDHPNIATVLDGGTTPEGQPYFVMELVKGVPITTFCDDRKLTPRERLALFVPVCQAVQHAHQKGVIHRDIKPSNVLVALYDDRPVPKVIDFGVAKATGPSLTDRTLHTGFGAVVGTLEYMSPEQAGFNQLDADTRSDVYSLGVLLYELLAGSPPFARKELEKAGVLEMLRVIREQEPSRPSARLSTSDGLPSLAASRGTEPARLTKLVRGELDWIVMKCLEKDRTRRYETANAFAADVQRYLADEPVQACPPSARYRFGKFARRNGRVLATAAALAVAVLAVAGTLGWAMRDREANAQQVARDKAASEAAVREEVGAALAEAERLRGQEKWSDALSAARRAEGLLAGGGDDELRGRVRRLRTDLEIVLRLEEIRLARSDIRDDRFDWDAAEAAYAQAFADYGIDVSKLAPDAGAMLIRERPGVTQPLTVAIDDWALVRRWLNDPTGAAALTAVAQAADADPWRRRVREAIQHKDAKALVTLATSPALTSQPPVSVLLLGNGLWGHGNKEANVEVLRQAQRRHPGDFWINYTLGWNLGELGPVHGDEAVTFSRVALALRPQSVAAHNQLGLNLRKRGKFDEAAACFLKAVELNPRYTRGYANLGNTLKEQGKPDEAVAWLKKAVDRPQGAAHLGDLGLALQDQPGKLDEAIACHQKAIALEPLVARNHYNLGTALDSTNPDGAIAAYRAAIHVDGAYVYAHHNLGCNLRQQGKLGEAMACFDRAIGLQPKRADSYEGRASVYRDLKQYDKALADYATALDLNPEYEPAWSNRGMLYFQLKQYGKAQADVLRALELKPADAVVRNNSGTLHRKLKQYDNALADYSKAIELKPGNHIWWRNRGLIYNDLKQYDKALADFTKATELSPADHAAWHNRGEAHRNLKQYDKAILAFTRAIELNTNYAWAWEWRHEAYGKLGQYDKALAEYTQAVERNPAGPTAWQWRHRVYQDTKQIDSAIAAYSAAIKLSPDRSLAWYYRGISHLELKQHDKALADFTRAIELDPNSAFSWSARHSVYQTLKQYDNALAEYARAVERNPMNPLAWQWRHRVYQDTKQYDKAVADYSEAIRLKPDRVLAWQYRGRALHELTQHDKAVANLSEAIRLKPDDAAAWTWRGRAHASLGQYDKAVADFTEAVKLDPNGLDPLGARRAAYEKLNRWDKVVADQTRALELRPDWIQIKNRLARLLANCPDPKHRNPARAVELAKEIVAVAPTQFPAFWNTLGAAHFRAGDSKAALAALRTSMDLRKGGDALDWYFAAMAHWQSGDRDEARRWYDRAVAWADMNPPQTDELRQFRAEAETLLGIDRPEVAPLPRPKP